MAGSELRMLLVYCFVKKSCVLNMWFNKDEKLLRIKNAYKVSCSRTQHTDAEVQTVNLCIQKPTF